MLALSVHRSWRGGTGTTATPRRHGCRCPTAAVVAGTKRPGSAPTAPLARAGRQARGLPAGGTEMARALGHCAPRRCASCYRARSLTTNPRCARPDERSPYHLRACRRARQHTTPPRRPDPTPPRSTPTRCLPPTSRSRSLAGVRGRLPLQLDGVDTARHARRAQQRPRACRAAAAAAAAWDVEYEPKHGRPVRPNRLIGPS